MRFLRQLAFYLCCLIYVVVCPLTILYILGYVIQPGTTHRMTQTGLITVATLPPDATVYLNHRRYTQRTPTIIPGLLPGEYQLMLLLPHYAPWTRTVAVMAEKASVYEKVLLLPPQPTLEALSPATFDHLLPLPETPFVLLLHKDSPLADVVVYDENTGTSAPLLPGDSPWQDSHLVKMMTVKGSPCVVARVRGREGERWVEMELGRDETRLTDLTTLLPDKPQWITWDPQSPHQLFTFRAGSVNHLDVDAMAIYPQVVAGVRGYGLDGDALYVLTDDLVLQRMDQQGQVRAVLSNDLAAEPVLGTHGMFHLTALPEDLLLIAGERGELLIRRPPAQWAINDARGFAFDAPRHRLLVWCKDRIGVLDLAPARHEDDAATPQQASLRWIVRDGRDIAQAFWVYDGSHVLFRDHHTVYLLELNGADAVVSQELLRVRSGSAIVYMEESGKLYYVDRETGRFMAMTLLPKSATTAQRFLFREPAAQREAPAR